jgi:large subunit ribosomal protein L1
MAKKSRRYLKESEGIKKEPIGLEEAVNKVKSFKDVKFDQSIECVLHLGIDPKQADQIIRGAMSLPHGIGKQKKVAAFCEDDDIEAAKQAGAVEAGCDELVKKVEDGWMDFDVAIASPKVMGKVGKLGRFLGPQGKMPSPKNGTVTDKIADAVKDFSAGKLEFRNDSGGNVHAVVGKQGFSTEQLMDNIKYFVEQIKKMRPASVKGLFIKKISISGTMTPGVNVSL